MSLLLPTVSHTTSGLTTTAHPLLLWVLLLTSSSAPPTVLGASSGDSRIEHFVVLFMENRPFDHYFGCMDLDGADSGATKGAPRRLPVDPANPEAGSVDVTCGTAKYVCSGGTAYSLWASKFAPGADVSKFPYSPQNDSYSYRNGAKGAAIQMFAPEQLPVKTAIANEFGVFNKLYSSVPAASTPNHLCMKRARILLQLILEYGVHQCPAIEYKLIWQCCLLYICCYALLQSRSQRPRAAWPTTSSTRSVAVRMTPTHR